MCSRDNKVKTVKKLHEKKHKAFEVSINVPFWEINTAPATPTFFQNYFYIVA